MEEKNERQVSNEKNIIAWRENHDENALIELMSSNEAFINFFVMKYTKCGIDYDDLFSIGREAFLRAINMFDYKNHSFDEFTTYAGNAIKNTIIRELKKEYAHKKNISIYAPISNNDEDEATLEDVLGTDVDALVDEIVAKFKSESIQKFFATLTPMEKKVIVLRFAFGREEMMRIPEIAKELKVSKHVVKTYEKRALLKLREFDSLKDLMV